MRRSIPDATVHILGAGPYEARLRALVASRGLTGSVSIEYIPPDERERMARALAQAAVFAGLSEYEAHPVAVMEALTLGIPAVSLDTAGAGDLVADGLVAGVPRDASAATLAAALVAALREPAGRAAATLPTWETAADDLAGIYRQAAGAGMLAPGSCGP